MKKEKETKTSEEEKLPKDQQLRLDLYDWIQSLSVDEFCDYKFIEASDPELIEGE